MIHQAPVAPAIPVVDMERAKKFYHEMLGLELVESQSMGGAVFAAGEGTKLYLYERAPSTADHTLAGFQVQDIEEEVADLSAKGVEFLEYDTPPIVTENSIATIGNLKAAWFKDSEGNILSINQAN